MPEYIYDNTPQVITIAPLSGGIAGSGTGSFRPISISKTPFVAFQITKLTNNNSLETITLRTSNVRQEWQGTGIGGPPTGSADMHLWYNETSWSVSPGGIASGVGGASGSVFSGSVALSPFVTGSFSGSVVFQGSLYARYGWIELRSTSGGRFQLVTIGKGA